MSPQRHPIVEGFYNCEELAQLLAGYQDSEDLCIRALDALSRALVWSVDLSEAVTAAEAALEAGSEYPDLIILMLCSWIEVSCAFRRTDEAGVLVQRLHGMLGDQASAEDRAMAFSAEGMWVSCRGNKLGRLEFHRRALEQLPESSPFRPVMVTSSAGFLAQIGRWAESTKILDSLKPPLKPRTSSRADLARLIGCAEAADIPAAAEVIERLRNDPLIISSPYSVRIFNDYAWFAGKLSNRWGCQAEVAIPSVDVERNENHELCSTIVDALLAGDSQRALKSARLFEERHPGDSISNLGFDSYNLVRAELSAGNGEAALRMLDIRHRAGNFHFIDDLFLARARLLAGDTAGAREYFQKMFAEAERQNWRHRIDFEIRLCCELSPVDIFRLVSPDRDMTLQMQPSSPGAGDTGGAEFVEQSLRGVIRLAGESLAMRTVRENVKRSASLDVPVLISGPTGSGKELVARALHEEGKRASEPFLAVNCGSIAEGLLESELFGHSKGAFTGAVCERDGLFASAGRGTLFLDEIGDMPSRLQVALLRVLEEREVRKIGSSKTEPVECRVIAAGNTDLGAMVEEGRFRKDLFYRLRRLEVVIPPLAERPEDIAELTDYFLCLGRRDGIQPKVSAALREALASREWPGNVRELRNVIERMRLLNSDKGEYDLEDLGFDNNAGAETARGNSSAPREKDPIHSGRSSMRMKARLRELFAEHGRLTRSEIARTLGVSLPTATRYLKALCAEGTVNKVMPTASPRTHYFVMAPER